MADGVPLGPYTLVRKLAMGGMAEIFLAKKEGPEGFARELVVKRMLPHLTADPALSELFRAEARIVARMNHPNVVHVYDFGQDGGTGYLVMELVRGVDLRALIERAGAVSMRTGRTGAVPAHHAAKLLSFVCEGLAHAHGTGDSLVHRDVTPSNVLVSFDGAVKVADFGVAKLQQGGREDTGTGMVRGKFAYLSPEQARGEHLDLRSDLYNVGILLFEAVTGEDLFPHDDPREAKRYAANGQIPQPERLASLGPKLAEIARKALSSNREDRYRDALAMREDLEAFLRGSKRSGTVEIGKYVRALFPDVLAADRRGPRAAGTVELEGAAVGTAPMTQDLPDSIKPPPGFADLDAADTDARTLPGADASPIAPDRLDEVPRLAQARRRRRLVLGGLFAVALLGVAYWSVQSWAATRPPDQPRVTQLPRLPEPAVLPATLRIRTTPPGLEVRVDGEPRGLAPVVVQTVPGPHRVTIWDDERETAHRVVQLTGGQDEELVFEVENGGSVHVATRPEGAIVYVGDARVGRSPVDIDVTPGEHPLRIELAGYETHEESVSVENGSVSSISVALLPDPDREIPDTAPPTARMTMRTMRATMTAAPGLLTISSSPWSTVYLGRRRLGITPLARVSLPAGRHTLVLRAEGRPAKRRIVVIRSGEETRVREAL